MALRDVSDEAVWSDKEGIVRKVRLSMVTFIRWRAGGFGEPEGAGFITVVSKRLESLDHKTLKTVRPPSKKEDGTTEGKK